MGLDMYLYKRHFIRQANWYKVEERQKITIKKGGKVDKTINPKNVIYIVEEVAYWRKANHIHNWFITNVQNCIDSCQESYVTREHLEELLNVCKTVKQSPEKAPELLPTTTGFFFGDTDYTDWYFEDIDKTIKLLENALQDETAYDFTYCSSW
jgi:hypothetical protein